MSSAKITVLMSVYNGLPYLADAIDSILKQTFKEFEFLIIDDCSYDGSTKILQQAAKGDPRITLVINEERLGLGENLKKGVQLAKAPWIARMDADDISTPNRLQTQYNFACKNQDVDIIGSWAIDINEQGEEIGPRKMPLSHDQIVKYIWTCPIIHPTIFFKKDSILKAGSYGNEKRRQDYALWFRCAKAGLKFANIDQPLIKYRFTDDYFKKNNLKALLSQVMIGWKGCLLVGTGLTAYIGVAVPLIKGVLPKPLKIIASKALKKFDPRHKHS